MVTSTGRTPPGRVYGSWGVFTLTAPSLGPGPSKKTPRREAPCGACLALPKLLQFASYVSFIESNGAIVTESTFEERFTEWGDLTTAMRGQSDLGKVLIAASYFDNALRLILKSYMVEGRAGKDLIDGPQAPLGSFSGKINLAYALGLLTQQERSSLHAMRKVRNTFAHNVKADFNIEGLIDEMHPFSWVIGKSDAKGQQPDFMFEMVTQRLGMNLLNRADHAKANRLVDREWPHERTDFDPDYDPY